jgi:hypothetical protein
LEERAIVGKSVGLATWAGLQPPRRPQQFSIRKFVSRFTVFRFAEYEMERPFLWGWMSSVAARMFK